MAAKKNDLELALLRAQRALRGRCKFALVGGLAVSVRVDARTTKDVDLAISVANDAQAEELVVKLQAMGYRVQTVVEQTAVARMATARLLHPDEDRVFVDLLFSSSGIEPEIVEQAEPMRVLGADDLPVAAIGDLLAMKVLSRDDRKRPQDWDDLRNLSSVANETDLARARSSIHLIEQRGYQRNRNLLEQFEQLLVDFASDR
jgi:predicted nucleotidyltransferase